MAKNLYNLTAATTVNDSDLLHVNQGSVSSDKKVTKANLLKEVNSSITSLNNSLTNSRLHYADKYYYPVTVGSSHYVKLGSVPTDFGISNGDYIVSFNIRGWSGANGVLSLAIGSNGTDLYLFDSAADGAIGLTVRLWYVASA